MLGSYQTIELIETFVNYAESIKRCVCIVYDPQTSVRGTLTLKAITLKDNFIKVCDVLSMFPIPPCLSSRHADLHGITGQEVFAPRYLAGLVSTHG